jgi:uncharacterized protein
MSSSTAATDKDPFEEAASGGDVARMKELVASGNISVSQKLAAMKAACRNGHLNVVEFLVTELGVSVDAADNTKLTALFSAATGGHLNVVKFLFDAGANVEEHPLDNIQRSPLSCCCLIGLLPSVKYLVEYCHANVNTTDYAGWTPLIMACSNGHLSVVQYLVEQTPAIVAATTHNGETALQWAERGKHADVVNYLKGRAK